MERSGKLQAPTALSSGKFAWYALGKGARGSVVLKALCYKLEGRRFETR
jgi:hypothetical protein